MSSKKSGRRASSAQRSASSKQSKQSKARKRVAKRAEKRNQKEYGLRKEKRNRYQTQQKAYHFEKPAYRSSEREYRFDSKAEKQYAKGSLEARANAQNKKATRKNLEAMLSSSEVSAKDKEAIKQYIKNSGVPKYKSYFPTFLTGIFNRYSSRLKHLKGMKLSEFIKEAYHLFRAFTDSEETTSVYKQIEKTPNIFLPGFWKIPNRKRTLEKNAGIDLAYLGTNDKEAIYQVIKAAARKHGYVNLIGFSDGGRAIRELREMHPDVDSMVGRYVTIGSLPHKYDPKVVQIIGGADYLAAMEPGYEKHFEKGSTSIRLKGIGHAGLVYNKKAGQAIGSIIKSLRPWKAHYGGGITVTSASVEESYRPVTYDQMKSDSKIVPLNRSNHQVQRVTLDTYVRDKAA